MIIKIGKMEKWRKKKQKKTKFKSEYDEILFGLSFPIFLLFYYFATYALCLECFFYTIYHSCKLRIRWALHLQSHLGFCIETPSWSEKCRSRQSRIGPCLDLLVPTVINLNYEQKILRVTINVTR